MITNRLDLAGGIILVWLSGAFTAQTATLWTIAGHHEAIRSMTFALVATVFGLKHILRSRWHPTTNVTTD